VLKHILRKVDLTGKITGVMLAGRKPWWFVKEKTEQIFLKKRVYFAYLDEVCPIFIENFMGMVLGKVKWQDIGLMGGVPRLVELSRVKTTLEWWFGSKQARFSFFIKDVAWVGLE
jgi:hypothetical protein